MELLRLIKFLLYQYLRRLEKSIKNIMLLINLTGEKL